MRDGLRLDFWYMVRDARKCSASAAWFFSSQWMTGVGRFRKARWASPFR